MADFSVTRAAIELTAKDKATKTIKKTSKAWKELVGAISVGNIVANATNKILSALKTGLKAITIDAANVAARIQVLNRVFRMTGENAGYSTGELEATKNAVMALGIAQEQALNIGMRFIQAQLDLGDATKVARAAQDLAVISGQNSSDTAITLTNAIVKQRPILLKQFGIIANLNDIYGRQAAALDKTVDSLTKTEKRQAFLNEILRQSATVAGSYEAAMQDVGKRLTSLPRHLQDAQNAVGTYFLPAMAAGVDGATEFLKMITRAFSPPTELLIKSMGKMKLAGERFAATSEQVQLLRDEYRDLTKVTGPSVEQQARMNTILRDLEKLMPGVVLAIESETVAMRSNLEVLDDLVEQREQQNRAQEAEQLAEVTERFIRLDAELKQHTHLLARSRQEAFFFTQATDEQKRALEEAEPRFKNMAFLMRHWAERVEVLPGKIVAVQEEVNSLLTPLSQMFLNLKDNAAAQERLNEKLAAAIILYQAEQAAVEADRDAQRAHAADTEARAKAIAAITAERLKQAETFFEDHLERHRKAQQEHDDFMVELDQLAFDTRMIGLEEHQVALAEAEREHLAFMTELDRMFKENALLSDDEYHEARNNAFRLFTEEQAEINRSHNDKIAKDQAKHLDKLKAEYLKKWKFIHDGVTDLSTKMARIIITDSKNIGREMKAVFEEIGRTMVVNLVQVGLKALFEYIAGLAVAKTAAIAEIAIVKAQTSAYISLAAAKSAASLGTTTGLSIAGAAATKAALIPMLMSGFDDPINDAAARRWGVDAGTAFLDGFSSVTSSPGFGRDTVADLQGGAAMGGGGDVIEVTIVVQGNLIAEDEYIEDRIGPGLERAIRAGRSKLVIEDDNLTGNADLGFV